MDTGEIELTKEEAAALLFEKILAGSAEEVSILLEEFPGIANEFTDDQGDTALHLAAAKGNKAMASILVEKGHANIHAKNQKGQTPAEAAKENQRTYFEAAMGYPNTDQAQEYLAQVASDLKVLHKSHIENTTSPWLAELKNQDDKKLSDLVQERKAKEHPNAKAQEGKRVFDEEMAARALKEASKDKTEQSSSVRENGSKANSSEAEIQRIGAIKEHISNAITDPKIKKLFEEQMDYYTSANSKEKRTTKVSKIDFLAEGINTLKKLNEIEKELDLDKISKIAELKKITDTNQQLEELNKIESSYTSSKNKITNSIKQIGKDVSTKELAKLVAPKRTSAKLAKLLTFGYRKTDNDLAKEAIEQLSSAIHAPEIHTKELAPFKRWSKNKSTGKQV